MTGVCSHGATTSTPRAALLDDGTVRRNERRGRAKVQAQAASKESCPLHRVAMIVAREREEDECTGFCLVTGRGGAPQSATSLRSSNGPPRRARARNRRVIDLRSITSKAKYQIFDISGSVYSSSLFRTSVLDHEKTLRCQNVRTSFPGGC